MKKIVTTPPVDIALRTLDADGVRKVHAWFDHLRNWEDDEFVRAHSHTLEGVSGVYVLKTGTDIRIFFRIDGNTVTILDIAKKAAIMSSGGRVVAKNLETIVFEPAQFEKELKAYGALLKSKTDLSETGDVQPFFESHKQLSAYMGTFSPNIGPATELAFRFPFFGAYASCGRLGQAKEGRSPGTGGPGAGKPAR
jgi:mRNA-degrading endonuclease RelE of RelBE toxin-antitoxin system